MTTMTPFGPQLIGETEKTLNALLRRSLTGTGLSERHWVSLVIASTEPGGGLSGAIATRAHFTDASALVADLRSQGLLDDEGITAKGGALVEDVRARTATVSSSVWGDLAPEDVAATTRVLNIVRDRARDALASS